MDFCDDELIFKTWNIVESISEENQFVRSYFGTVKRPSGKNALCGHWISDFFITYFLLDSDAAKKLFLFSLLCLAPPEAAPELHRGGTRSRGARLVPAGRGARRPPVGGPVSVHLVSHRPPAGARGSAWSGPGEEREDVLSAL